MPPQPDQAAMDKIKQEQGIATCFLVVLCAKAVLVCCKMCLNEFDGQWL